MSRDFEVFDLFATPLRETQLIEASAGTGKTYTIAGLFLRLLLEGLYRVDQILVVTFTNAATEELKDRIRKRLVQLRDALMDDSNATADPVLAGLLARLSDRESAIKRLENAIRGFDEAAIFTIHGFCQRVLADRAFASAMPFESELRADVSDILQEVVEDFWRRRFFQASPLLIDYLLEQKYSPDSLLRDVRPHLGKPYLQVLELARSDEFEQAECDLQSAFEQAQAIWLEDGVAIRNLLQEHLDQLSKTSYGQDKLLIGFQVLDEYFADSTPKPTLFNGFERFTQHKLRAGTKKNCTTPQHEFFLACERLWQTSERLTAQYQNLLKSLRVELLQYAELELARRKRREQIQSYDDLLLNLHRALKNAYGGENGEELAEQLRERYPAALIDEFQDTDPIQYDIFSAIYKNSGLPVFLVGDPKQAIYSFRGADIFAYLRAHHDARRHTTLGENWRSQPALIDAVNRVFQQRQATFVLDEIEFHPVQAAGAQPSSQLDISGDPASALWFWFARGEEDDKALGKSEAREQAARWTAAEIARLLNASQQGQASLDGRPLHGGDIAVLVRKHEEGRQVREALLELGIASVQQTRASVFASPEAREIYYLLRALAEPGREALVRAALATRLIGKSGAELYALSDNDQAWESVLEQIHKLHQIWLERGFVRMFRLFLREFDVSRRLLSLPDGERRLTNILHIMELLQEAEQRQRLGQEGLVVWLAARLAGQQTGHLAGGEDDEAQQLRLESDSQLVQVLTVHKSKGLEYPIVFCPYLWDGRLSATDKTVNSLSFHNPQRDYQATLDLGSDQLDDHRPWAAREELAENLRLAYVALTRAKHRCYVIWGKLRESETSSLAWLLHPPPVIGPGADPIQASAERVKKMHASALYNELARLVQQAPDSLHLADPPAPVAYTPNALSMTELRARIFPGPVRGRWQISSFSALVAKSGGEQPDYDASPWLEVQAPAVESVPSEQANIFDFPKGARAGRCLHQLFENLDFAAASPEVIQQLVEQTLPEYGFDRDWTAVVTEMVGNTLRAPLNDASLCLADVKARQRLNELEFYYPLARLDVAGLRQILTPSRFGALGATLKEELDALEFAPTRGYMKGFIDCVFEANGRYYLIDYKSNWLGAQAEDYQPDKLVEPMTREGYVLQYLIYTIALHRYLRLRLPDYEYSKHFGGVYYLFLRGMHPDRPGCGVFRDWPEADLIHSLDSYLEGRPRA